ncbi:hypothetical protein GUITHDRAFT_132253 [Guillardia theta CCMP2712]|uniref:Uncharacterized protein n=1 Tax=Guillardia theta (strain CCMP2712) TaxID=905079 RepID=L1K126_GUITC|nr:hypothetical protein GUITHDRAFT_132253 [Guillardia theta CCMP2712]EKX54551.1 hypothetical protein GUITHDRAFT_132253 [Guillardia theta CCMP2712]|eukprot:XP_005841531.1 hypothetical protein GUITHDRAFT_132253 [Guillardia theta CCMP2712]
MLNKPNLKENIRIFIVHRGSFCWAVCLCFLLPTLVDNTYALLPSCLTENKFVLDRDLLDQFVILDFPRTHPNAIIEVASKVLFAGGKNPVEGETICADIEELKQIAAAMGISIARSRVMEMIRKANLVRAERIAQKRISLSSHVYEEALRLDPSHWSLLVLLGNSQLSEGRTKDAVQNLEIAIGGLENDCCESCEASRVQELNRARYLYLIAISLQHNTEMTNAQTDEFYKSLTHHSKNLLSHEVESDAVWYLLGKLFSRLSRWNGSRKVVFAEVCMNTAMRLFHEKSLLKITTEKDNPQILHPRTWLPRYADINNGRFDPSSNPVHHSDPSCRQLSQIKEWRREGHNRLTQTRFLVYTPGAEGWGNRALVLSSVLLFAMHTEAPCFSELRCPFSQGEAPRAASLSADGLSRLGKLLLTCGEGTECSFHGSRLHDGDKRVGGPSVVWYQSLGSFLLALGTLEVRAGAVSKDGQVEGEGTGQSKDGARDYQWAARLCKAAGKISAAMDDLKQSAAACWKKGQGSSIPFLGVALRTGTRSHAGAALVEEGQQVDSYSYLDNDGDMTFMTCLTLRIATSNLTTVYVSTDDPQGSLRSPWELALLDWFMMAEAADAVLTHGSTFGLTAISRGISTHPLAMNPISVKTTDLSCTRRLETTELIPSWAR